MNTYHALETDESYLVRLLGSLSVLLCRRQNQKGQHDDCHGEVRKLEFSIQCRGSRGMDCRRTGPSEDSETSFGHWHRPSSS